MKHLFTVVAVLSMLQGTALQGAVGKYLIRMPGSKPELASSIKKVSPGKYRVTLDPTKQVKKGKKTYPVSFEMVKVAVEKRLKKFKVAVSKDKGDVFIVFKGDEQAFLKALAKARIRPLSTNLAVASSVSDGGVRARTSIRDPQANEVRALIVSAGKPVTVMVQAIGKSWQGKIAKALIKVDLGTYQAEEKRTIYFIPLKKDPQGIWSGSVAKAE